MDDRIAAQMFQSAVQREYELWQRWDKELAENVKHLQLLRQLKSGETDLDSLLVTDDGWQIMPRRPGGDDE